MSFFTKLQAVQIRETLEEISRLLRVTLQTYENTHIALPKKPKNTALSNAYLNKASPSPARLQSHVTPRRSLVGVQPVDTEDTTNENAQRKSLTSLEKPKRVEDLPRRRKETTPPDEISPSREIKLPVHQPTFLFPRPQTRVKSPYTDTSPQIRTPNYKNMDVLSPWWDRMLQLHQTRKKQQDAVNKFAEIRKNLQESRECSFRPSRDSSFGSQSLNDDLSPFLWRSSFSPQVITPSLNKIQPVRLFHSNMSRTIMPKATQTKKTPLTDSVYSRLYPKPEKKMSTKTPRSVQPPMIFKTRLATSAKAKTLVLENQINYKKKNDAPKNRNHAGNEETHDGTFETSHVDVLKAIPFGNPIQ